MKSNYFLLGLLFFVGFAGCNKEDGITNNLESYLISYQKVNTWTDYYYYATIEQNGKLIIKERIGINNQSRTSEFEISSNKELIIRVNLNALMSIELPDEYGFDNENAPTDLPITKIKYKTAIKSDSTCLYFPEKNELPNELDNLIQVVQQVILENDTISD